MEGYRNRQTDVHNFDYVMQNQGRGRRVGLGIKIYPKGIFAISCILWRCSTRLWRCRKKTFIKKI